MLAVPPRYPCDPLTGETPIEYDYDGQGRETRIERPGPPGSYDASLITITYDALGRRASETQRIGSGPNRTVAWQYDIAGRPTRLTWPDAFYVTYEHSPAAQLTAIEDAGGAALVSLEYNVNGWLNRIVRANGLETAYGFDPVGRVSRINHIGQVYTDFTYNPASQIATRELSGPNWAWDEGLNVDLDYERNTLNQYTEVGGTPFAYDLNGNLTDDGPNGYVYDPENRMLRSVRGGGGGTIQLRYDGRGRLMRRWGAGDTGYIYDGDAMIAEYDEANGAVLRRYIHGAGVDDPLIWYEGPTTAAANRRYLHADERGSIITVTNDAGNIVQRNRYDEWGVPGAGNIGRFQYTGQQWLPEIGLYNYKSRYYNPGVGRFMQTDPIGYEDGMNLYAYVRNDPLNGWDPSGMYECKTDIDCDVAEEGREQIEAARDYYASAPPGSRIPRSSTGTNTLNGVLSALGTEGDGGVNIRAGNLPGTSPAHYDRETNTIQLDRSDLRRGGLSLGAALGHEVQHYRQRDEHLGRMAGEVRPLAIEWTIERVFGGSMLRLRGGDGASWRGSWRPYIRNRLMRDYCRTLPRFCGPATDRVMRQEFGRPF